MTDPAEQVARIRRAASAFMVGWVEGLRDLPGNPARVHVERLGDVVALACGTLPDLDFVNTTHGLDPAAADRVGDVTALYRRLGLRGWTEVAPAAGVDALLERLSAAGWSQAGFWCSFHGPAVAPPAPAGVEVAEAGEPDMADFARIHLDGHEVRGEDRNPAEAAVRAWYGRPGWRLYLARVDGAPAACGGAHGRRWARLPGERRDAARDARARLPDGAPLPADRRRGRGRVRDGRLARRVRVGQPAQPGARRPAGGLHSGRVADGAGLAPPATATGLAAGRCPKS